MRFIRAIVLSTVATLTLVTCSNSDSGGLSLEEFVDQTVALTCDQTVACTPPDVLELLGGIKTANDCISAAAEGKAKSMAALLAAIEAGKIAFYPERAEACLTALDAASCGQELPECSTARPIEGKLATGSPCNATITECQPGLYCKTPTNCLVGTCTAAAQKSTNCSAEKACDLGLRCANGTCTDTGAVGDRCTADADCISNFCSTGNQCRPLSELPKLGESCQVKGAMNVTCWQGYCKEGANDGVGTCTAYPRLGETCGGARIAFCIGAFCDLAAATPTCVAFKANGSACATHNQCESRYCDTTCKAKKANGQGCSAAVECQSAICDAGTCAADACP